MPLAELKPGHVKQVDALGKRLAVWRSKSGRVGVLDAFCPHGGASLCGGDVVGETLRCPFHLWKFNTDGSVAEVPWLEEPPAK